MRKVPVIYDDTVIIENLVHHHRDRKFSVRYRVLDETTKVYYVSKHCFEVEVPSLLVRYRLPNMEVPSLELTTRWEVPSLLPYFVTLVKQIFQYNYLPVHCGYVLHCLNLRFASVIIPQSK